MVFRIAGIQIFIVVLLGTFALWASDGRIRHGANIISSK
jgi:hypothetical protein